MAKKRSRKSGSHRPTKTAPGRRPIWKGHVSFGLVQIPVVLHSAEARYDLSFHLLDSRDHSRVRYERVNESTGEEVPWNEVVKAFEYDDNNYVVLTEEDFKRAAVEATQSVAIEEFVDLHEISPLYFDKPYYLLPGNNGERGYSLLREALKRTNKVGIARVVIRTKEYLSVLMVQGRALVLMLLRFHQELRRPVDDELPGDAKHQGLSPKELDMAEKLVSSMSGEWKPEKYHDHYRDALKKWIEKKARSGGRMPVPDVQEPEVDSGRIINITDLLQKSLSGQSKRKQRPPARRPASRKRRAAG